MKDSMREVHYAEALCTIFNTTQQHLDFMFYACDRFGVDFDDVWENILESIKFQDGVQIDINSCLTEIYTIAIDNAIDVAWHEAKEEGLEFNENLLCNQLRDLTRFYLQGIDSHVYVADTPAHNKADLLDLINTKLYKWIEEGK